MSKSLNNLSPAENEEMQKGFRTALAKATEGLSDNDKRYVAGLGIALTMACAQAKGAYLKSFGITTSYALDARALRTLAEMLDGAVARGYDATDRTQQVGH